MNTINLWSIRWSTAWGYHVVLERKCETEFSGQWLKIFQDDMPGITFIVATKKPKVPKDYKP